MSVVVLRVPKLGMEMTEGTLVRWLADDGATVVKDQPLYLLETDKVEQEVPSPAAGVLRRLVGEGATHAVGETIGEIAAGG